MVWLIQTSITKYQISEHCVQLAKCLMPFNDVDWLQPLSSCKKLSFLGLKKNTNNKRQFDLCKLNKHLPQLQHLYITSSNCKFDGEHLGLQYLQVDKATADQLLPLLVTTFKCLVKAKVALQEDELIKFKCKAEELQQAGKLQSFNVLPSKPYTIISYVEKPSV